MSDELSAAFKGFEEAIMQKDEVKKAREASPADDDPNALKEELESTKIQYGEEVLRNIKLDHERRQSIKLAEEWRKEAEQLKEILEVEQLRRITDQQQKEDLSPSIAVPSEETTETSFVDKVADSASDPPSMDDKLRKQFEAAQLELGDVYLEKAKLQRERRESVLLMEKWKNEAAEFKDRLGKEEEKRRKDVEIERRKSQLLTDTFRTEISDLRGLLGDEADQVQSTENTGFTITPELLTSGDGSAIKSTDIRDWSPAQIMEERRQSVLLAERWKKEAEKFRGLLDNNETQHNEELEMMTNKLEKEQKRHLEEVKRLKLEIEDLKQNQVVMEAQRLELVRKSAEAIDETRAIAVSWSRCLR